MKPFSLLINERMHDPERAVREAIARLERWSLASGSKQVTLDEVAWLATVFALGGVEAGKMQTNMSHDGQTIVDEIKSTDGSRIVIAVVDDNNHIPDSVGG